MGIYSTVRISRSEAEDMYRAKQDVRLTNEELEDVLFTLYCNERLNNYIVVDDEVLENEDKECVWCLERGCDKWECERNSS